MAGGVLVGRKLRRGDGALVTALSAALHLDLAAAQGRGISAEMIAAECGFSDGDSVRKFTRLERRFPLEILGVWRRLTHGLHFARAVSSALGGVHVPLPAVARSGVPQIHSLTSEMAETMGTWAAITADGKLEREECRTLVEEAADVVVAALQLIADAEGGDASEEFFEATLADAVMRQHLRGRR